MTYYSASIKTASGPTLCTKHSNIKLYYHSITIVLRLLKASLRQILELSLQNLQYFVSGQILTQRTKNEYRSDRGNSALRQGR